MLKLGESYSLSDKAYIMRVRLIEACTSTKQYFKTLTEPIKILTDCPELSTFNSMQSIFFPHKEWN